MMFDHYAADSKTWIFVCSKELDLSQNEELKNALDAFVAQWQAHGKPLEAAFELKGRLLVVCVNAASEPASGCSIDKLYLLLHKYSSKHQVDFMDRKWLLAENGTCLHAHRDVEHLAQLKGQKIVDLSVNQSKSWIKQGYIPVEDSWVGNKLK